FSLQQPVGVEPPPPPPALHSSPTLFTKGSAKWLIFSSLTLTFQQRSETSATKTSDRMAQMVLSDERSTRPSQSGTSKRIPTFCCGASPDSVRRSWLLLV